MITFCVFPPADDISIHPAAPTSQSVWSRSTKPVHLDLGTAPTGVVVLTCDPSLLITSHLVEALASITFCWVPLNCCLL